MPCKTLIGLVASLALWIFGILAGFSLLQQYSLSAGPAHKAESPEHAVLNAHRTPGRPLLVMAVHPLCPCTESCLAEFGNLLVRTGGACDALLLQLQPRTSHSDEAITALPQQLGGVKVPVVLDRGGKISAALGVSTPGHAVFMDAQGEIRFQGGLAAGCEHGQDAILAILRGRCAPVSSAPLFDCTSVAEFGSEVTR